MRRFVLFIPFLLIMMVGLCACSSNNPDTGTVVYPHAGIDGLPAAPAQGEDSSVRSIGYFSYQPPILPVTLTIGSGGTFSIEVSDNIVTPLGVIHFGGGVTERSSNGKPLPTESVGVTQLIICRAGSGQQVCRGYAVRTGRRVSIAMNGKFKQTIEDGRVTIDAYPGSTVTVTDSGAPATAGPRPAARIDVEEFEFSASSPDTEVNLERHQGGRGDDLSYDHVSGAFSLINGAMVADIRRYAAIHHSFLVHNGLPNLSLPDENDCAKTKPTAWQSSFTAENLKADIIVACIATTEKDFGYLVIGRDRDTRPVSYHIYSYTWVR